MIAKNLRQVAHPAKVAELVQKGVFFNHLVGSIIYLGQQCSQD
jgi:hypothetical protein